MTAQRTAPAVFDKDFALLASELSSAYTKALFFDHLFADQNLATLNAVAPGFFSTVQEVLFDDLVLTTARLADPVSTGGTPNLVLARLVEMVDATLFPQVRVRANCELCRLRACCDALRIHRNKRIAHNDLQTCRAQGGPAESPADLFAKSGLPLIGLAGITETLEVAESVMSVVSEHFKGVPFKLSPSGYVTLAVPALLELLRSANSQPSTPSSKPQ